MAEKEPRVVVREVTSRKKTNKDGSPFVLAKVYSDGTILVRHVRASYPHVGNAYATDEDKAKGKKPAYSCVGLMPKETHIPVKKLLVELKEAMLADNKVKAIAEDRIYLRDGDKSAKDANEGMYTISTRESNRPFVKDAAGKSVKDPDKADEMIYGGCWVNLLIRPWFQNHKEHGKRINCGLTGIQFVKNDTPFGEGRISEDDIDETFDSEDEDDDDSFDADEDDDL